MKISAISNEKRIKISAKSKKEIAGWLFISPFLFGFFSYFLVIIIKSIQFSFSKIQIRTDGYDAIWVGLQNYLYALRIDPTFTKNLVDSITLLITNVPTILIFSLFIAVVLNQSIPGRTFFRAVFFIPVIVGTGLMQLVDSNNAVMSTMNSLTPIETGANMLSGGLLSFLDLQQVLEQMDFNTNLVSFVSGAANNIINIVNQSGVQIIIFLAGLQSIPKSIYESADIEGASSWESFWKITFPMISPIILVNLFYSVIAYLSSEDNAIMGQIKNTAFGKSLFGEAAAMSWIYFLMIALLLTIILLIIRKYIFYDNRKN